MVDDPLHQWPHGEANCILTYLCHPIRDQFHFLRQLHDRVVDRPWQQTRTREQSHEHAHTDARYIVYPREHVHRSQRDATEQQNQVREE